MMRGSMMRGHDAGVEKKDTGEQDRKPLVEGKSGIQELAGKIEQQTES